MVWLFITWHINRCNNHISPIVHTFHSTDPSTWQYNGFHFRNNICINQDSNDPWHAACENFVLLVDTWYKKGLYWLDTSFNTCELLSSNHVSWRQRNIGWYRFITSCKKSFLWWLIPSQLYEIILRIPIILTSDISNAIWDPSIMSYLLSFPMLMGRYSHYSDYPFSHKKICKLHHQAKNRKTLPGPCLYFGQWL